MKTTPTRRPLTLALALCLLAFYILHSSFFISRATAQTAPPTTDDDIIMLDEFNVSDRSRSNEWIATQALTGSRMAERVVDLPYQMQIITDEYMKDFNLVSVVEQLGSVSGLTLEADQSDPVAAASRGVGGNTDTKLRGFPVLITRDGFKHAQPPTSSNTQQVEVIKGPVSVFYGNMQPGGMINYISRRPAQRLEASGRLSGGSYDYWQAEASINAPLVRKRVFFLGSYDEMHRKSDIRYVNTKSTNAYGSLLIKPFRWTSLTATLERQAMSGNRGGTPNLYINTKLVEGTTNMLNWDANTGINSGLYWDWVYAGLNNNGPEYWINRMYDRLHLQFEQRISQNWSFKAAFQWQRKLTDINGWNVGSVSVATDAPAGTPLSMNAVVPEVTFQDWRWPYNITADLRGEFRTGKIKHTLLFTADAGRMMYDSSIWRNRNPTSGEPGYDAYIKTRYWTPWDPDYVWDTSWFSWEKIREKDRSWNPYYRRFQRQRLLGGSASEVMRLFNDRLIVRGTVRYDETHQSYHQAASGNRYIYPWEEGFTGWIVGNDYELTWSTGMNWRILSDDRLLFFANYSTSFDTTMTIDNGIGTVMPHEKGKGCEIGIKTITLSGKLTAVLSYFWTEKRDIAQSNPDYGFEADVAQYLGSGVERVQGFDLDMNCRATKNLTLIISAAYAPSKVVASTADEMGEVQTIGQRKLATPDTTLSISTRYAFSGWLKGFEAGTRTRYQSDWTRAYFRKGTATAAERPEEIIGGTTIWNAFLKYQWKTGRRTTHVLQLNTNNLFGKIHTGLGASRSLGLQVNLTYRLTCR